MLFGLFNVDYLAALVGPGLGIDAVRNLGLTRVLVQVKLRCFQSIVGTARAGSCM